jgi:hypothetical protein
MMDELTPWWTVVALWLDFDNPGRSLRWMGNYQAASPQVAEDLAKRDAQANWTETGRTGNAQGFLIADVFPGAHQSASAAYTPYSDREQR